MKKSDKLVWLFVILFSTIYAFMSVYKHNSFQTFGWDLAIFDHGIWQWSKFKIPYSSFHDLPWLADHFHLILITLAPLYWVWSDVKILLITQAFLVCMGALPLYYLSKKVTRNYFFSVAVVLNYLLFYSLQSFIFSDFHEFAFLPINFGLVLLFWEYKRTFLYWIFFMLTLLVKEEIGLLLAAFGLWSLLRDRTRWKQAIISIFSGLIYTYLMLSYIMPAIGGQIYRHSGFGQSGQSLQDVVIKILSNPLYIVTSFTDSPIKINTMVKTFLSWGFLPVFSPATLVVIFEQFTSRFLDYGKPIRWTLLFAYSLPMASLMAWASIYGFNNLVGILHKLIKQSERRVAFMISLIILIMAFGSDLLMHGPINNILKPQFYYQEKWVGDNLKTLKCIPDNISVSAQNSLAPWLSQRTKIKVFPEGIGFDYIILDLHPGQSENSFHFLGSKNTKIVLGDLIKKDYYLPVCQNGDAIALKRKSNPPFELNYPFPLSIEEK